MQEKDNDDAEKYSHESDKEILKIFPHDKKFKQVIRMEVEIYNDINLMIDGY